MSRPSLPPLHRSLPWVLALGVLALFAPVVAFSYLSWDDVANISGNPQMHGFTAGHLRWAWTSFHMGHYTPLAWTSFLAEQLATGTPLAPVSHAVNLLLHAFNAVCVFFLMRKILCLSPSPGKGEVRGEDRLLTSAAFLAAAWWALHPWRVESVAWASQRRDLLAGALLLPAALAYLSTRQAGAAARRRGNFWTFGLFAASLFAKAIGAVFPAVLLVLDEVPLRSPNTWRQRLTEKAPHFALSVVCLAVAAAAQRASGAAQSFDRHPFTHRIVQAAFGLAHSLAGTLLSWTPRLVQEFPDPFLPLAAPFLLSLAAVAALAVGAALAARRGHPGPAAALAVFAFFLAPTLGFFQSGPQLTASRYTYLAALAPAAAGAWLLARARSKAPWIAAALLVLFSARQTHARLPAWKTSVTFWRAAAAEAPDSALAHSNLGEALASQQHWEESLAALRRAVELSPLGSRRWSPLDARINLGYALYQTGHAKEAEPLFREVLSVSPSDPDARDNLALALLAQGRVDEALQEWSILTAQSPDFAPGHANFAVGLAAAGRLEEAAGQLQAAVALQPQNHAYAFNLSVLQQARAAAPPAKPRPRAGP